MPDPFLIAHKVRGEPAFDVAIQMTCPECEAQGCHECDNLGYWWIIPTSGHRAYPWGHVPFTDLMMIISDGEIDSILDRFREGMPPSLPDHYPTRATPTVSLLEALGLRKPKPTTPTAPIARRF